MNKQELTDILCLFNSSYKKAKHFENLYKETGDESTRQLVIFWCNAVIGLGERYYNATRGE